MAVIESEKGWGRRGAGMLDTTLNKMQGMGHEGVGYAGKRA